MSFISILDGSFVVWHANVAQVDIALISALPAFNKIDLLMAANKFNKDSVIKVYTKTHATDEYSFLTQLAATSSPSYPIDGSFVEVMYSATFPARSVSQIRIIITADGINPQELTPVKKYTLYNNNTAVVGNSQFQTNDLGWRTGEVFKTIFRFLSVPISPERPVDLGTETAGLLAESKISNDDLLARVADHEDITGDWDFQNGQILVERGDNLPAIPKSGRIFYHSGDKNLYIGDETQWVKLLREDDLSAFIPVKEEFNFSVPTSVVPLIHNVDIDAPIWLVYEGLPQHYGIDFVITGNILSWVNSIDTEMLGKMTIFYYRKLNS